jgi:biotin carboxyl carrier protein
MRYDVEVNGQRRRVAVNRQNGRLVVDIDGRSWTVDAVRVGAHGISLLVQDGAPLSGFGRISSHDVTLAVDAVTGQVTVHDGPVVVPVLLNGTRRSGRKEEGVGGAGGAQRLVAPMPGKVVRVLVKPGDPVRARQPIVVVEAMKMENELRSGRDGVVTELSVKDGQSVDSGTLIAVISSEAAPQTIEASSQPD